MNKLLKYQKIIYIVMFVASILLLSYPLSFSTDIFEIKKVSGFVVGLEEVRIQLSDYNFLIFDLTWPTVVIVALFLLFGITKRPQCRIGYIFEIVGCLYILVISIYMLINITPMQQLYLSVDFEKVQTVCERFKMDPITPKDRYIVYGFFPTIIMMIITPAFLSIVTICRYRNKKLYREQNGLRKEKK